MQACDAIYQHRMWEHRVALWSGVVRLTRYNEQS